MKIYLNNGNVIKVSKEEGNLILDAYVASGNEDIMFSLNKDGKRYATFKFAQIDAIK
jgi:hypothetical protein